VSIAENLEAIAARVSAAARAAGRQATEVKLVAVSKTHPEEAIREAYATGQRDFGENYAQELRDKAVALADLPDLRWHFIGHLQTNKAKFVGPVAALVHAVDRIELAAELAKRAAGRTVGGCIEVNVGGEPQKHGVVAADATTLAKALLSVKGFELRGLMCLPPAGRPPRPFFAALRELRDALQRSLGAPLPELSMGMSDDFEDAIAEGATCVRVGTAIFGARPGTSPSSI
jgi:PLP dependent protein